MAAFTEEMASRLALNILGICGLFTKDSVFVHRDRLDSFVEWN